MEAPDAVNSTVKERIARHAKFQLFHELLTTEERYVSNLEILNNEVYPLVMKECELHRRSNYPSKEEIDFLYMPLKPIVEFHSRFFCPEIRQRNSEWDTNCSVADIFIKNFPFMKLYTTYVVTYPKVVEKIVQIQEKYPKFQASLVPICNSHPDFSFPTSFKGPLIRITKYKLIIDSYLKKMSEDDTERVQLLEAQRLVNDVAGHCNKMLSQKKSDEKLYEICSQFTNAASIFSPGRTFVMEDEVKWGTEAGFKSLKPMKAYLFSDVLMIASKGKKKKMELYSECQLSRIRKVQEITLSGTEEPILSITTMDDTPLFLCPSDGMAKVKWMEHLKPAIAMIPPMKVRSAPSTPNISSQPASPPASIEPTPARKHSLVSFTRMSVKSLREKFESNLYSPSTTNNSFRSTTTAPP